MNAAARLSQCLGLGNNAKAPGWTKSKPFIQPTPFNFLCAPGQKTERDYSETLNNGKKVESSGLWRAKEFAGKEQSGLGIRRIMGY